MNAFPGNGSLFSSDSRSVFSLSICPAHVKQSLKTARRQMRTTELKMKMKINIVSTVNRLISTVKVNEAWLLKEKAWPLYWSRSLEAWLLQKVAC